jgi:hypothetical protein
MDVKKLMVVALAGWTNQEQNVIDYATVARGLVDCFATTTGMPCKPMNYQRFQFSDTTPPGKGKFLAFMNTKRSHRGRSPCWS